MTRQKIHKEEPLKKNKMDIEHILKENPCWYVVNEDNNTVVNAKILYDNWKVMAWYGDDAEEVPREQLVPSVGAKNSGKK